MHDARKAARRAGPSAIADTCFQSQLLERTALTVQKNSPGGALVQTERRRLASMLRYYMYNAVRRMAGAGSTCVGLLGL